MHERRFNRDISTLRAPARLEMLEPERAANLALDGLTKVKTVLDVGTGSGIFAEKFAAHGLKVSGLDANPVMLAEAQKFVPDGLFKEGIAEQLLFDDAEFDLVFMGLVLHETDDPLAAVREAYRVTRKRLAALEWVYEPQSYGPPLSDRLAPDKVAALAHEAGFKTLQSTRLEKLVLYLFDK